ncbi:hypothetical protein BDV96DRAFT_496854 [Lophiotrema nucula]|uniref:Uncharacterized protein n=1 Tax=Lophiotrema nucula TaxID=690887 RepID=A0A6A5Z0P7_9PLEO|nr:hypothetical protein BDV96DRAFT_496854 [Lophiotrema nucula]
MHPPRTNRPDPLRIELAHAVGYPNYPDDASAEPHLNYITARNLHRGTQDEYIRLFIRVIEYFKKGQSNKGQHSSSVCIQALLDGLAASDAEDVFADTRPNSRFRKEDVEDTVLYIFGVWSMMLSSFLRIGNDARAIRDPYPEETGRYLIYGADHDDYQSHLADFIRLHATRLNAYTLNVFGALEIYWTHDISRHMLLSQRGGRFRVEIFALPCAFQATTLTSEVVGISAELAQEIKESYGILFNAWPDSSLHAKLGFLLGIRKVCPCWSCSANRFRNKTISAFKHGCTTATGTSRKAKRRRPLDSGSGFDPLLEELMNGEDVSDWTYDLFPHLWQRIAILEAHLQRAKPWSIWILFRDRRDTLQFWTFGFATIVVLLTFLQVALGVAQVVGSFK